MKQPNNFTKKCIALLIPIVFFVLIAYSCFANTIQIKLNGNILVTPIAPITQHNTTLVPLRIISENLGAQVNFDQATKQITIEKENQSIVLTLGKRKALVNNVEQTISFPPTIFKNTTMVPLRFVSENLNCHVEWDQKNNLITITSITTSDSSASGEQTNTLPIVTLKIKDYGTVTLELYPDMAPNTVNNFISLANSGYYDGLIFHRIISGFMIQGGDPTGTGTSGPGYAIAGEFASNGFTQNTLSHTKGVISMARTLDPDSAGSQFFIMSADGTYLDGQYAAFGKVTSGLDIIEKIQNVKTNSADRPTTDVIIQSIRVNTQGITYPAPTTIK